MTKFGGNLNSGTPISDEDNNISCIRKKDGSLESNAEKAEKEVEYTGHLSIHMVGSDVPTFDWINLFYQITEENNLDVVVTSNNLNIYGNRKKT